MLLDFCNLSAQSPSIHPEALSCNLLHGLGVQGVQVDGHSPQFDFSQGQA